MGLFEKSGEVIDASAGIRVLHQHGEQSAQQRQLERAMVAHDDINPQGFRARFHHLDRLRVTALRNEHHLAIRLARQCQAHRFGCGRALIQQRGVRHIEAGEVADHGLEVQQSLQPSLGDFRLIGSVGGVPAGVFQNVALDHRRGMGAVVTLTNERFHELVFSHHVAQFCQRLGFGECPGQLHGIMIADDRRHGGIHQVVHR